MFIEYVQIHLYILMLMFKISKPPVYNFMRNDYLFVPVVLHCPPPRPDLKIYKKQLCLKDVSYTLFYPLELKITIRLFMIVM